MYFTATVTASDRKVKENLDNMTEVQEFAAKMEKRGFVSLQIDAYNESGFVKSKSYSFNGLNWE